MIYLEKAIISIDINNLELFHKVVDGECKFLKEKAKRIESKLSLFEYEIEKGIRADDKFTLNAMTQELEFVQKKVFVVSDVLDQIEQIWENEE